jgi:hypothetical protein
MTNAPPAKDESHNGTVSDAVRSLLYFVLAVQLVLVVGVVALFLQVDDMRDTQTTTKETVEYLQEFVDDVSAPSDEELALNAAIAAAVALVPRIKDILCEQFPDASSCRE